MTQDSTQLLEKIELLDFNLISGPNDSTRVTQKSQITIDLAFANFPCTSRIFEHAITDHYGVEVDFNIERNKILKTKDFTVEIMENCKSRNSNLSSTGFTVKTNRN